MFFLWFVFSCGTNTHWMHYNMVCHTCIWYCRPEKWKGGGGGGLGGEEWVKKKTTVIAKDDKRYCSSYQMWRIWKCAHVFSPQERDWAIPAPSEAWVLRETGDEGYPDRPAHDLHATHCLHGQLHEKVCPETWLLSPTWNTGRGVLNPMTLSHYCTGPSLCLFLVGNWYVGGAWCVLNADSFPSLSHSILPFEAVVCMYRFLGADKCMYPFLAQRKQAMNNNEAKNGI